MFAPRAVAIVGASATKGKIGKILLDNLVKLGYAGKIYPVNPARKMVGLRRCYSSVGEIRGEVDLAVVAVPAKFVPEVIKDGADKVKNWVVISAGFAESGKEGAVREKELEKLSREKGLNILGPNCLGFIVPGLKLNASFAKGMPQKGNVALVSQSGALAVALIDKAGELGIGFSHVISVGNKAQLGEAELLEELAADKSVKVVAFYLEGIKDGRKFYRVLEKVSVQKPVIILKAGAGERAQKAIASHTGALAGSAKVASAAFAQAGAIEADNIEQFFSLISLAAAADILANKKICAVTNAGGVGVLTTDALEKSKLEIMEISEKMKKKLAASLPAEAGLSNPLDVLGDADAQRYRIAWAAAREMKAGIILTILTPQDQTPVEEVAQELIALRRENKEMLAALFVGGGRIGRAVSMLRSANVATFDYPESAVEALSKYAAWKLGGKRKKEKGLRDKARVERAQAIIRQAQKEGLGALSYGQAAELFALYGIRAVQAYDVQEKSKTSCSFPVALKVDSDKVLHKSDKQGVVLGIKNETELAAALEKMRENFPGEKIIVQPMLSFRQELILGMVRDASFGPVAAVGLGGIYTEVFDMADFFLEGISRQGIREKLESGKLNFLFQGLRGQSKVRSEELATMAAAVLEIARENPEIKEVDVNPLFVLKDASLIAADIKVIL